MNIVVCVKYVPDAQAERGFEESDRTTDRVGVDGRLSELDEYAVEEALKIVEAGEGQVTVLTMGPEGAADAVKKSLQMGASAGVHVSDEAIAGSDAVATSLVLARAIERKDFDTMVGLYAPTFRVKENPQTGPGGWSREQSLAYQKASMERVQQTRLISNTITRLSDCGDRATATVLQQWYRTQNMAGGVHTVETAAVQDEEWINTAEGWKRGNISNVHPGAWLVDGKRVDPTKGFNPDAPPYDPYPETSSIHR